MKKIISIILIMLTLVSCSNEVKVENGLQIIDKNNIESILKNNYNISATFVKVEDGDNNNLKVYTLKDNKYDFEFICEVENKTNKINNYYFNPYFNNFRWSL